MYLPLIALAALGYLVYRASKDEPASAPSAAGPRVSSPNVVLVDGVQHLRKVDDLEMKKISQRLGVYQVRPEPILLHVGPLAGAYAVVLDKGATSNPDLPSTLAAALGKASKSAGPGADDSYFVVPLDVADALLAGESPDPIVVIAATPDLAAHGCTAPSAYAIWDVDESAPV